MREVIKRSLLEGLIAILFSIGSIVIMAVGVLFGIVLIIGGYTIWGIAIAVVFVIVGAIMRFAARNVVERASERGRYRY